VIRFGYRFHYLWAHSQESGVSEKNHGN